MPAIWRGISRLFVIAVVVTAAAGVQWVSQPVHAAPLRVLDVPMPPRSRAVGDGVVRSGRGFRATVDFYKSFLKRSGFLYEGGLVYRYRGVDVVRFLMSRGRTRWIAIHVWRQGGRVMIDVVARDPLTPAEMRGKEASP